MDRAGCEGPKSYLAVSAIKNMLSGAVAAARLSDHALKSPSVTGMS